VAFGSLISWMKRYFGRKLSKTSFKRTSIWFEILKEKGFEFSEIFEEYLGYKKQIENTWKNTSFGLFEEIQKKKIFF